MKTVDMRVADLIPYEFNNKVHDSEQVNRIANSIREFWFTQPLVVDQNNVVIIGHGRLLAAMKLGMETVPVLKIENLTETQIKKLRILDNKLNESERDEENLKLELEQLDWDLSIWELELKAEDLFELELEEIDDGNEVEEDEAPEVEEAKVVQESDFFSLWNHRLLCWDSTKSEDVQKLMWNDLADMIFTDPPRNVNYWAVEKDNPQWYKKRTILNDYMWTEDFKKFMAETFANMEQVSKPWCMTYVVMSAQERWNLMLTLAINDFHWSSTIIWNKDKHVLSRKDYHTKYEPIRYWWKEWEGWRLCPLKDRTQSDVRDFDRPMKSEEHPTMKPVWLVARAVKNSSKKKNIVLDLFLWSWTTIIACEQTDRICYWMELDPKYCEVIIKRFHKLNPEAEIKCVNRDIDLTILFDEE